jgi:ferric-dicitrate binding protein FerR (iron transport regulator)
VAAAIILIAGAGLYTWFASSPNYQPATTTVIQPDKTAPIANKAILTLADGTVIDLDKTGNGAIAREGKTIVNKKEDGLIEYQGSPVRTDHPGGHSPLTIDHSPAFNTLANPRGSKVIQMTLGDGSRVWLNAGSSITYPVAFLEKERKVSITGEAYFEVAHNPNKPFIVSKGNTTVQVLGTHFNVNAYDDEAALRVTLLEGSVKVGQRAEGKGQRAEIVLKPGEQAELAGSHSSFTLHPSPDLEQVVAWKNGEFQFNENTDINAIMRQISRWYDVEVVYQGTVKGRFWGSIPRTSSVSQVLTLLQKTGGLNYTLAGNKVTLMP